MAWNMKHATFPRYFPDASEYARRRALGEEIEGSRITLLGAEEDEEGGDGAGGLGGKDAATTPPSKAGMGGQRVVAEVEGGGAKESGGQLGGAEACKPTSADLRQGETVLMSGLSEKNAHYNGVE